MPSLRALTVRYMNGAADSAAVDLTDACVDLPELEVLSLSGIGTMPRDLGALTRLHTLQVRGWYLTSIPSSLVSLAALETLRIDPALALPALPEGFERLRALRTLRLGQLATDALPRPLLAMPWLTRVELISGRRWPAEEEALLRRALPNAYVHVAFTGNAR